jgi:hypothetical protein
MPKGTTAFVVSGRDSAQTCGLERLIMGAMPQPKDAP